MLKKISENVERITKSSSIRHLCIFVVLMVVIVFFYVITRKEILKDIIIMEDDYSWVYQVDSIDTEEKTVYVSGWAFELLVDAQRGNCEIILQDVDSQELYFGKMEYHERNDVNAYFACEYDYNKSGFRATFQDIYVDNAVYEVLLRPTGARNTFSTGIYYANGEMMFVNPADYIPLKCEGAELAEVVQNGVLRVYEKEQGMYVYQYKGELYWIAEDSYGFVNGDAFIQYQLYTTQPENLPEERINNGWSWDNLGFVFSTKELNENVYGKYRVAKSVIPTNYSVTRIWTGNYSDNLSWRYDFRPWYELGGMQ